MTGHVALLIILALVPCSLALQESQTAYHRFHEYPRQEPCCQGIFRQTKLLEKNQDNITTLLLNNRKIIFAKVNDDIEHIKVDVANVLEGQNITHLLIEEFESKVLANLSVVLDYQDATLHYVEAIQGTLLDEFPVLKKKQAEILRTFSTTDAKFEKLIADEHSQTRDVIHSFGSTILSDIHEIKALLKALQEDVASLKEDVKGCCRKPRKPRKQWLRKDKQSIFH